MKTLPAPDRLTVPSDHTNSPFGQVQESIRRTTAASNRLHTPGLVINATARRGLICEPMTRFTVLKKELQVHTCTLRKWIEEGGIVTCKLGRVLYVVDSSWRDYVKARTRGGL